MKTHTLRQSLIALAFACAFGAGYALHQYSDVPAAHAADAKPSATAAAPAKTAAYNLPDFTSLVETQGPAVVSVQMTRERPGADAQRAPEGGKDDENPFGEFFRRFPPPGGGGNDGMPMQGRGSGFIVSTDGYILTNAHVVEGASEVSVMLDDKREFSAKVVGTDRRTDVALIKVDAKNLPTVKIGNPEQTKVGEWVAAIGAPFGLENTVTAGIVSAKARSLPDSGLVPFLQTDVAVNPGNSGGPLFNMQGEVIGINSQIYSRTGGYMGLSFAIPIDLAMDVKEQLQAHGKVSRGRIGVVIQDLNKDLAQSLNLGDAKGAVVSNVEKGGPADKAGIKAGDVITAVNGKKAASSAEVARLIGKSLPGVSAEISLLRGGKEEKLKLVLTETPTEAIASAQHPGKPAQQSKLGVAVRPLTSQEQEKAGQAGVVVEQAMGPAQRAGIRAGDIIVGVNSDPVNSPEDLKRLVEKAGKRLALLVERNGSRLFVPIELG